MTGQIIRVAIKGSNPVKIIGNVLEDKWFDIESFYKEEE
jgi:hypothetical protein